MNTLLSTDLSGPKNMTVGFVILMTPLRSRVSQNVTTDTMRATIEIIRLINSTLIRYFDSSSNRLARKSNFRQIRAKEKNELALALHLKIIPWQGWRDLNQHLCMLA
jgi:hypothetical protein